MKKPIIIVAIIAVTLIALKLVLTYLESAPDYSGTAQAPENTNPANDKIQDDGSEWQTLPTNIEESVAATNSDDEDEGLTSEQLIEKYNLDPAKIESLRHAREHGDPRTPPIKRGAARELPTPEELADPELYAQYEQRQNNKFFAAYVRAVDDKVARIRAVIDQGKEYGVSEEDIAMAEDKIKRIQDMAARILEEHPDVADQLAQEAEAGEEFPLLEESQ